jgi:hypothetical protein
MLPFQSPLQPPPLPTVEAEKQGLQLQFSPADLAVQSWIHNIRDLYETSERLALSFFFFVFLSSIVWLIWRWVVGPRLHVIGKNNRTWKSCLIYIVVRLSSTVFVDSTEIYSISRVPRSGGRECQGEREEDQ